MAYIKLDKLGRICQITKNKKDNDTPEEYKETLNMFRGQQGNSIPACFQYLNLSVQKDNPEAQKELQRIHYMWNNKDEN